MGMKVKLNPSEYWPSSCSHSPKTLSFRHPDSVFKTLNSVYFDDSPDNASQPENNNDSNNDDDDTDVVETIVRGAHSGSTRLFFEPSAGKALSVPASPAEPQEPEDDDDDDEEEVGPEPFKESLVMAMESHNPYVDFRRSMEEMMQAHALLKDWASLEDLLAWYLRVNARNNHAYIVAAFVDLLVKFSASSSSNSSNSDDLNSSSLNVSSCSTSRSSSSSCACAHCRDQHLRLVMARKSKSKSKAKSTTSFSSAASSFSSSDEAGDRSTMMIN